jgi:hypothetical protein
MGLVLALRALLAALQECRERTRDWRGRDGRFELSSDANCGAVYMAGWESGTGRAFALGVQAVSLGERAIPPARIDGADKPGRTTEWFPFFIIKARAMDMMDQWFGGFRPGSAWRQLCPRHARTPGDSAAPRRGRQEAGPCLTWMGGSSGFPSTAHWNRTRASPLHAKTVCCALIGTQANAPLAQLSRTKCGESEWVLDSFVKTV